MSYSKEIMFWCEGRNIRELFMRGRERNAQNIPTCDILYKRKSTTVCTNCSPVLIKHALREIF